MSDPVNYGDEKRAGTADAAVDGTLELLASHRRREIIRILIDADGDHVAFAELATAITRREEGNQTTDRDEVIIDLHHRHLPKLAEGGVVEYDERSGDVRYHGDEDVEALLEECSFERS